MVSSTIPSAHSLYFKSWEIVTQVTGSIGNILPKIEKKPNFWAIFGQKRALNLTNMVLARYSKL